MSAREIHDGSIAFPLLLAMLVIVGAVNACFEYVRETPVQVAP